jgi:hypothetical protein
MREIDRKYTHGPSRKVHYKILLEPIPTSGDSLVDQFLLRESIEGVLKLVKIKAISCM